MHRINITSTVDTSKIPDQKWGEGISLFSYILNLRATDQLMKLDQRKGKVTPDDLIAASSRDCWDCSLNVLTDLYWQPKDFKIPYSASEQKTWLPFSKLLAATIALIEKAAFSKNQWSHDYQDGAHWFVSVCADYEELFFTGISRDVHSLELYVRNDLIPLSKELGDWKNPFPPERFPHLSKLIDWAITNLPKDSKGRTAKELWTLDERRLKSCKNKKRARLGYVVAFKAWCKAMHSDPTLTLHQATIDPATGKTTVSWREGRGKPRKNESNDVLLDKIGVRSKIKGSLKRLPSKGFSS